MGFKSDTERKELENTIVCLENNINELRYENLKLKEQNDSLTKEIRFERQCNYNDKETMNKLLSLIICKSPNKEIIIDDTELLFGEEKQIICEEKNHTKRYFVREY